MEADPPNNDRPRAHGSPCYLGFHGCRCFLSPSQSAISAIPSYLRSQPVCGTSSLLFASSLKSSAISNCSRSFLSAARSKKALICARSDGVLLFAVLISKRIVGHGGNVAAGCSSTVS